MTTATRFDAASDRATYSGGGGAPPTPSAGWAASWWVYIAVDQNTFSAMLRLWAGGTVLNLAMGSSGTAPGAFTGGGTVEVGTQCVVGNWYYLGYTVSGSTVTIYVFDAAGALFATASGSIGGGTPTGLTVGGRDAADPDEWFNGRMSRMRMWSAPRTQGEFAAEQFAAEPVITANLWEHWPLTGAGDLAGAVSGHDLVAGSTATSTEDGPPLSTGVAGSATVALGDLTVAASGTRTALGQATVSLSELSAVATGIRTATGQASVSLGGASATATGIRGVPGQASVFLGGPAVAASGIREVRGSTGVALPGVGVSVIAAREVRGGATVTLPALSVLASGRRDVVAAATVTLGGVTVGAVGKRLVRGSATVALPGLHMTVVILDDHDVDVVARLAPQGRIGARLGVQR